MKILYEEVLKRFPEIGHQLTENELPYNIMWSLVHWLKELPEDAFTPELVERLVSFTKWCEEQPRGENAGNDLHTILAVGFYEKLFDSEKTLALLPRFIAHEDFAANEDYLRTWVGEVNYEKARKYYKPSA